MTLEDWTAKEKFNKKVLARFENLTSCGRLEAKQEMPLIIVEKEAPGIKIALYVLVDSADGVIADCKFKAFAPPLILAALDVTCEILLRRHFLQTSKITEEMILKPLDESNLDLSIIENLLQEIPKKGEELELPKHPQTPLVGALTEEGRIEGWEEMPLKARLKAIEDVINEEVRPYIELDEGGIEIEELIDGKEVVIRYSGACTSCHSSVGSTLTAIQEILRAKIHPEMVVTPKI